MFFLIALLALLGGLVVTAGVIDWKARRRKTRYSIDPGTVQDHRRISDARSNMYSSGGGV
ncbi:MAG: hypothetical protein AVDCRST_MAG41-2533 [uncultured Corynebacteriales bacterium]|uniref:Uncharacterized protein n=1 Tax=uncultured Mycobacteriales bacterium TaxID=581187 RepID=A0A6J4J2A5_9ACTN|nr:MAG: hypothetical protein AVDCRST_MAG41-2533 [uncultured Corynebacteriales bacterium]